MSTPIVTPNALELLRRNISQIPRPPANPTGLVSPGNINIYDRPIVPNPEGGSSTVFSSSFGTDNGELLLPRVSDGADGRPPHIMSNPEALKYYKKTGQSLGTFDTPDNATAYAQGLHNQQAALVPFGGRTSLPSLITPDVKAALQPPQAPALPSMPMMPSLPSLAVPTPPLVTKAPNAMELDQKRVNDLHTQGSGIDQIHNPLLRGIARAGDIAASVFGTYVPAVRALQATLPGTSLHHQVLVHQAENNLANDQANQKSAADVENVESQAKERESLGNKADALAAADTPMPITAELAQAAGAPQLEGISMTPKDYQRLVSNHQTVTGRITTNAATNDTKKSISDDRIDASTAAGQANRESRESIADAANKTRTLIAGMHDATSRSNNANTNNHKGTTGSGNFKVPADVTKRAALGANATENANAVDALLHRNPSIVGAAGGRYSSVQDMIGSNDPDIAELGVRMHNIALASNGAHGIRAAQAIQKTEDELFKDFKRGPDGIHSALNATRDSMQTFLNDEKNYQGTGTRTGNEGESKDPLGIR